MSVLVGATIVLVAAYLLHKAMDATSVATGIISLKNQIYLNPNTANLLSK